MSDSLRRHAGNHRGGDFYRSSPFSGAVRPLTEDEKIESLTGHIHFHWLQVTLWIAVGGALGAGLIAGIYFGFSQCNWHWFYFKPAWDHLFPEAWWPVYRHTAFRDIPEPAIATLVVMTVLAKKKSWDKRVGILRMVTAPFVVLAITFGLGIAGTWVLNDAFGHPILTTFSAGNLILGIIIGQLVHRYWAPVGATLQGQLLEAPAARAAARRQVPGWVRLPVMAPQLRQRMAKAYLDVRNPDVSTSEPPRWHRRLLVAGATVFLLVSFFGLFAHYGVGTFHLTIPWLMPVK
jgi:hypothetical protein